MVVLGGGFTKVNNKVLDWIDAKEELPTNTDYVLVELDSGRVSIGYWTGTYWICEKHKTVVYWQPYPKPSLKAKLMNTIQEQLFKAHTYAREQSQNMEVSPENRYLYLQEAASLSVILQAIHSCFGKQDSEHWFWRGDYL